MQHFDVAMALMLVGSALACAVVGLLVLVRLAPPRRITWAPFERTGESVAFLFEDDALVDATPYAQRLLEAGPEQMEEWPRLKAVLSSRFPDLAERLTELGQLQRVEVEAEDGAGRLTAEWRAGLTRIEVNDFESGEGTAADGLGLAALNDELADLRATVDAAPLLVWKEDAAGAVRWANSAYIERALANDPESETLSWPLPQLFPDAPWRVQDEDHGEDPVRLTLAFPDDPGPLTVTDTHFVARRSQTHDGLMVFALPADALERAQASLHEFVQTLTKTFAHLPIGLAIFDRDRKLTMFNPALTDLTKLQPLFLSRRPTLFDFLDQLREVRRMPEPKDYRDWRRRISELEHASSNGTHIETWSLPDGHTFRVTGRPHPDGAIAFLMQDITSEVSLTRRFRSELELGQAVVDSLEEAVAVFSTARDLVLSNVAYEALWGAQSDNLLGPTTLNAASDLWEERSQPSPLWAELRTATGPASERRPWSGDLRLLDGRGLKVRVVPLAGNALLVGFSEQAHGTEVPRGTRSPDATSGGLTAIDQTAKSGENHAPLDEPIQLPKPAARG